VRRAVVDIGSTACRLVVAEAAGGGWPHPCQEREVVLGLGRAVRRDGRLGEGRVQLTIETLRRMRTSASRAGAERLSATLDEAVFAAADGPHLHRNAEAALRTPVEVISAVEGARVVMRASRHRLGLTWLPSLLELADHRIRVARPDPDGTVRVREVPAGVADLVPSGVVDPLHPAAYGSVRARLAELLAPLADLAPLTPPGGPARWPVVVGAPAVALVSALSGRRRVGGTPVDGFRLSADAVAALGRDPFTARGDAGGPASLATIEDVAVAAPAVQGVLEWLDAPGALVSTVRLSEGRLWTELEDGPDRRRVVALG
jgi:hypothetical protein